MSNSDNSRKPPKRSRALAPIGDYEVGYGKPPKQHQFKKGQPSANPYGAPKGKRKPADNSAVGWTNGLHDMLIEEAMRPVQLRAGNKVVTLPVAQAAYRMMYLAANKGSNPAMRNVLLAQSQAQNALRAEKEEQFKAALEYKEKYTPIARRCDAEGIELNLEIHPDDIILDQLAGEVYVAGPKTPEEREVYQQLRSSLRLFTDSLEEACLEINEHPRRKRPRESAALMVSAMRRMNFVLPKRDWIDPRDILAKHKVTLDEVDMGDGPTETWLNLKPQ